MLKKKVLLMILIPLVVFILIGYGTFWYIKSSEMQKAISRFIKSVPNSSVQKISATGFPLGHEIMVDNINLKFSNNISSHNNINIKQLIVKSSPFSSNAAIRIVGDVMMKNSLSEKSFIKFNSEPLINIGFANFGIKKISYVDSGYKIVDSKNKTLFYVGDSNLTVEETGDKIRTATINYHFKNMSGFDIFDVVQNAAPEDKPVQNIQENKTPETPEAKKENLPALPPLPNQKPAEIQDSRQNTGRGLIGNLVLKSTIDQKTSAVKINDIQIRNVAFNSPLYKVNVSGNFSNVNQTGKFNLKIKNLDNILIYLRQYISALTPTQLVEPDAKIINQDQETAQDATAKKVAESNPDNIKQDPKNAEKAVDAQTQESANTVSKSDNNVVDSNKTVAKSDETVSNSDNAEAPAIDDSTEETTVQSDEKLIIKQNPEDILVTLINDIAKKNNKTNDEVTEFEIIYKGFESTINEIAVEELFQRLSPVIASLMPILKDDVILDGAGIILEDDMLVDPNIAPDQDIAPTKDAADLPTIGAPEGKKTLETPKNKSGEVANPTPEVKIKEEVIENQEIITSPADAENPVDAKNDATAEPVIAPTQATTPAIQTQNPENKTTPETATQEPAPTANPEASEAIKEVPNTQTTAPETQNDAVNTQNQPEIQENTYSSSIDGVKNEVNKVKKEETVTEPTTQTPTSDNNQIQTPATPEVQNPQPTQPVAPISN